MATQAQTKTERAAYSPAPWDQLDWEAMENAQPSEPEDAE